MEDGGGVAKAGRVFSGIVSLISEAVSYQAARPSIQRPVTTLQSQSKMTNAVNTPDCAYALKRLCA